MTNKSTLDSPLHGIEVSVVSRFLVRQSRPEQSRFAFAYEVTLTNVGKEAATLLSRHWVIIDGDGQVEHVRGPGVVGHQPRLEPGASFQYDSGAVLHTDHGTMQGEYLMTRDSGERFEATIPPFALVSPMTLN